MCFKCGQIKKYTTEVKWKSLDPVYGEKFSWNVKKTECLNPNSVIVFTVRDYDYLSKNDFLGEAIVPLCLVKNLILFSQNLNKNINPFFYEKHIYKSVLQ